MISDHDSPYMIINIKPETFPPRYKIIRDLKNFSLENYKQDFGQLPLNLVYAVSDPCEQLEIFNTMVRQCIDEHAPLKRYKMTRPPAPLMQDLDIIDLQRKRNDLRKMAHQTQTPEDWGKFRDVRNTLKSKIKFSRKQFY